MVSGAPAETMSEQEESMGTIKGMYFPLMVLDLVEEKPATVRRYTTSRRGFAFLTTANMRETYGLI
jgi:hypothetical protein